MYIKMRDNVCILNGLVGHVAGIFQIYNIIVEFLQYLSGVVDYGFPVEQSHANAHK